MTARPGRLPAAVLAVGVALVAGGFGVGTLLRDNGVGPPPGGASTSSTAAPAAPGLPPGTIRLGVPEEPASLNPFDPKSRTAAGGAVLGQVLPQLFQVDPGGRVVGRLADEASVKVAADGASAAFSLRQDARWSDGTPITIGDLRFTLDTVLGNAWPGPRAGYDRLTAVEGQGASVTFRFNGPFPGWRRLFSGGDFVLPAHRLAGRDPSAEWKSGPDLSGGPFRLGPVTPGLAVVLERNDAWWGGRAKAPAIQMLVVPDIRTMEQLLARRELDAAWPPAVSNRIGRFRAVDGVKVSVAEPGGAVESLVANTATLPADRRRAYLGLANRDRFVDVLLAGEATPAVSLRGPAAVPAAGNATWASAGLEPDGGRLRGAPLATLVSSEENPLSPLLGRVLQSGAQAAGTTLELRSDDAWELEGVLLPEGRFDLALVRTVAWPDPCWSCWFAEPPAGRGTVTRAPGLTALAAAADRDPAAVAALEARIRAEAVMLPLWRPRAVLAGREVGNLVANSWQLGPFWAAESWTPPRSG